MVHTSCANTDYGIGDLLLCVEVYILAKRIAVPKQQLYTCICVLQYSREKCKQTILLHCLPPILRGVEIVRKNKALALHQQ